MHLLRTALAIVALTAAITAQQASEPPSFTYFIADDGLPLYSMEALAVGPGGDIWGVGVSHGHTLPIVDPDSNVPPSGECQTGGYLYIPGSITPLPHQLATGPCTDVMAFRLGGDGSGIVFSKYLGREGFDGVADIAVSEDGAAYLVGSRANSPDTQPYVGYLVGLAPDGTEMFDLELPAELVPRAIALDDAGDIYIAGDHTVYGTVYEEKPQVVVEFDDVVVLKLDGESTDVVYEASLDEPRVDEVRDLAVDEIGHAYVVGVTDSADIPGKRPSERDVFVKALDPEGTWLWTTTLGGSEREWSPLVHWTVDGELLVAGITESADFPALSRDTATEDEARFWSATLNPATGMWLRGEQIVDDKAFSLEGVAEGAQGDIYLSGRTRVTAFITPGFALQLETAGGGVSAFEHAGAYVTRIAAHGEQIIVGGTTLPGLVDSSPARTGFTEAFYIQPLEFEQSEDSPRLEAVLNAAGRLAAELSPGAVVSLYGQGLGPDEPVPAAPAGGLFPTELAGVRVLVGGQAVPLLFVSEGQINAVLPFVLGPEQLIEVRVERSGESSNVFLMTQTLAAPEAFPVVINADGSLNSAQSPARRGTTVSVWLSGVGAFSPSRPDGAVEGVTGPYPLIDAPVRAGVQGKDAVVTYSGAAPGLVAGIAQINFVIPEQTLPGSDISFGVSIGEGPDAPGANGRISVSQ